MPIQAGSMVPKHVQLREVLLRRARETLQPGDAMPSERELTELYGVSRATVRRAVGDLVGEGVLVRSPAKGTFVAHPRVESHLHLASFTDDMRRRGFQPATSVLSCRLAAAPAEVLEFLGNGRDGRHWHLERLRLADEVPMALETGWYNARLLPHLDQHPLDSLYQLMRERHDLVIDQAEQSVWSQLADAELARVLHVTPPAVVMSFARRSSARGMPVEVVTSHYRGDRYALHMTLDSSMPAGRPDAIVADPSTRPGHQPG